MKKGKKSLEPDMYVSWFGIGTGVYEYTYYHLNKKINPNYGRGCIAIYDERDKEELTKQHRNNFILLGEYKNVQKVVQELKKQKFILEEIV